MISHSIKKYSLIKHKQKIALPKIKKLKKRKRKYNPQSQVKEKEIH